MKAFNETNAPHFELKPTLSIASLDLWASVV